MITENVSIQVLTIFIAIIIISILTIFAIRQTGSQYKKEIQSQHQTDIDCSELCKPFQVVSCPGESSTTDGKIFVVVCLDVDGKMQVKTKDKQ